MAHSAEVAAAEAIAVFLRDQAATLPTESDVRALMLRSAARWGRIAGTRRLRLVTTGKAGAA